MRDVLLAQQRGDDLGLLDADRTDQHRLPALVAVLDLVADGAELPALVLVDDVVRVLALDRLVRRDDVDVQLVDLVELLGLGVGGAGHAGQLLVEAEVVLVADRRQRLVLFLDLDAFLGLDGLVQAVRPAAARHLSAGELVDDDDLAVIDQVVDVALVERVRLQRLRDVVQPLDVGRVVEVADAQALLDPLDPGVGQDGRVRLLVDGVVDVLAQAGDDPVDLLVQVGRLLRRARDDERRARLVDQDRVDLVDDREVVAALNVALDRVLDVVAQVVEPELRVRAVRDVGPVAELALGVGQAVHDDADRHAQELVDPPHPLGVAAGQVVVDRDDVDALAGQRVQVDRQRRDQRLAFAGLHLGDAAVVQHHAADELHVEVAHAQHALARLAADGERLGQEVVQRRAVFQARPEVDGHGPQLDVGLGLHGRFELIDVLDDRPHAFEDAGVLGAENLLGDEADHDWGTAPKGGFTPYCAGTPRASAPAVSTDNQAAGAGRTTSCTRLATNQDRAMMSAITSTRTSW